MEVRARDTLEPDAGESAAPEATAWHALPADKVCADLGTSDAGLTSDEAARRLERYGPNSLAAPVPRRVLMRFLAQFNNLLIYVLLSASAVTLFLGQFIDAGVIAGVVVINAVVGFIQEGRAERALEAIRSMLSLEAPVLRDGVRVTIDASMVVPGDIVLLGAGDRVPADLRLLYARNLQIQEAVLTGESLPVDKDAAPVAEQSVLADRLSMAFSGTLATRGQGIGVAVATGAKTEVGRISAMIAKVEPISTPLLRQIGVFARVFTVTIVALSVLTFAVGVVIREFDAAEMFLAAVALAVAAMPEELPAIMTITLALGVQRMARRKAIVRHLPDVETLGSVTVICTDKTGTLTENAMSVQSAVTADGIYRVTGSGYEPTGAIRRVDGDEIVTHEPVLTDLGRAGLLCNDANIRRDGGRWQAEGDPTEAALVSFGMKAGFDGAAERVRAKRLDVLPFDAAYRYMATLHPASAGGAVAYLKGAPERVFSLCATQRTAGGDVPIDLAYWNAQAETLAGRGERLLALAVRRYERSPERLAFDDLEDGLVLIGLVGFADPPRREARAAIAECKEAGIAVKMVTGDHAVTALAIAHELGFENTAEALTGGDLDALGVDELAERAVHVDVFARTSPEHKLRLVEALQRRGAICAMTGDGVNDAPALKRADVGVAMGQKGTEAAKEAAGLVLADDNFATIVRAVEEGRTIYGNLRKSIAFILPTHMGEALIVLVAVLAGTSLPMTPVQILWVNMVTTVTLSLVFAFEQAEPNVMQRPPREPHTPILSRFLVWRVIYVGLIMVAGTLGMFLWQRWLGADLETARTMALHTIVCFELFYVFNARRMHGPPFSRASLGGSGPAFIAAGIVIALQLAITYLPPMQLLFQTRPIDFAEWGLILLTSGSVLVLVEADRLLFQARRRLIRRLRAVPGGA